MKTFDKKSKLQSQVFESKAPRPGPSFSRKVRHDTGLSDPERVLVHALRSLLDPKGKQRDLGGDTERIVESPKGVRSKQRGKEGKPATAKLGREKVVKVTVGGIVRSTRIMVPIRLTKAAKLERVKAAEKMLKSRRYDDSTTISPSRLARSERRESLQKEFKSRSYKNSRHESNVTGGPNARSKLGLSVGSNNVLHRTSFSPLAAVTAKAGQELTVETAFGGAAALDMLRAIRNAPKGAEYKHKVWIPQLSGRSRGLNESKKTVKGKKGDFLDYAVDGKGNTSEGKIRDFNLAGKDVTYKDVVSSGKRLKMSFFNKSLVTSRGVRQDLKEKGTQSSKAEGKAKAGPKDAKSGKADKTGVPSEPKSEKKLSPSQLRRKEKRGQVALAALIERFERRKLGLSVGSQRSERQTQPEKVEVKRERSMLERFAEYRTELELERGKRELGPLTSVEGSKPLPQKYEWNQSHENCYATVLSGLSYLDTWYSDKGRPP